MRKQEFIYGNNLPSMKNKGVINISTSSDLCVFNMPNFSISGASKITTGVTISSSNVHLKDESESIDLIFNFTNNLVYDFSFGVYKFNNLSNIFQEPSVYKSDVFTNGLTFSGSINSNIISDGEYIIKPQFTYDVCTGILNKLNLKNTTNSFSVNSEYYLYNLDHDFYFILLKKPELPIFNLSPSKNTSIGNLTSLTITNSNSNFFSIDSRIVGSKIITLNGLALSEGLDYSITNNVVELFGDVRYTDVISVYYVLNNNGNNGLTSKIILINKPILNGLNNEELDNDVFFNQTYNKFEIYLDSEPANGNDIILTLNGKLLTNKIDYNISLTNKKRVILEGNLIVGDLISIIYNSSLSYIGNISDDILDIHWLIKTPPKEINGSFNLQLALDKDFVNIISDINVPYELNINHYNRVLSITEPIGTKLFYRVLNKKNLTTLLGEYLEFTTSSPIIPIIVQTNISNNY